jgi:formylglycine-generating enzyme required for sulfatase activity
LTDYAWYDENAWNIGEEYAHAVGLKKSNPWGLFDLYGNVSEWCQDWYGDFTQEAQIDPSGPATGTGRVGRGGYFGSIALGTRSASRFDFGPDYHYGMIGARLVRIK